MNDQITIIDQPVEIVQIIEQLPERYELKDPQFYNGKSTYELYLLNTTDEPKLSVSEWLAKMKGEQGFTPTPGENGNWFINGVDTGQKAVGNDGKDFNFEDLTTEQINQLAQPAIDAVSGAIDELKGNVSPDFDTLAKIVTELQKKINSSETLTATEIQLLISNLVDSSPETLDTLKELADALGDDPNFATTVSNALGNKVDKVAGKGLSTNDLTQTLIDTWNGKQPTITPTADTTPVDTDEIITKRGGVWLRTLVSDWKNYFQTKLTFSTDIEADKASTTKVSAVKYFVDWAVNYFAPKANPTFTGTVNVPTLQQVVGLYFYQCASLTADTINDRRESVAAGVKKFERCTVANATKGGGTWVVDMNITAGGTINSYFGINTNSSDLYTDTLYTNLQRSPSTYRLLFAQSSIPNDTKDLGLRRLAAGILEIFDGITNGVKKSLSLLNLHKTGYDYFDVNPTLDSINDTRTSNQSGVKIEEICTVANATKGGGTWVKITNKIQANTDAASATNVGCFRYRTDANNSYCDMCMQTGASTYAWVNIKTNTW